jgi:hypothetical protein
MIIGRRQYRALRPKVDRHSGISPARGAFRLRVALAMVIPRRRWRAGRATLRLKDATRATTPLWLRPLFCDRRNSSLSPPRVSRISTLRPETPAIIFMSELNNRLMADLIRHQEKDAFMLRALLREGQQTSA